MHLWPRSLSLLHPKQLLKSKGFDDLMLNCFLPPWIFVIAAGKNAHYFVATMITIGRPSIVALLLTSPPGSANTVSNRKNERHWKWIQKYSVTIYITLIHTTSAWTTLPYGSPVPRSHKSGGPHIETLVILQDTDKYNNGCYTMLQPSTTFVGSKAKQPTSEVVAGYVHLIQLWFLVVVVKGLVVLPMSEFYTHIVRVPLLLRT